MTDKIIPDAEEIWLLPLYEFGKHAYVSDAARNVCGAMGPFTALYGTKSAWFQKLRNMDFDLKDQPGSGIPVEGVRSALRQVVQEDQVVVGLQWNSRAVRPQ